jgi:acetyltransferase-like isoleucine patch superfamily enzyme
MVSGATLMSLLKLFDFIYNSFVLKINNVRYDSGLRINGRICLHNKGGLRIGRQVVINSSLKKNPIGGDAKTFINVHKGAKLVIGDGVGISNSTIYCTREIIIADHVAIGGSCKIYDTDFHSIYYKDRCPDGDINSSTAPVSIGKGCWLGAYVIILKGVKIGEYSVIGAGSVVAKDIPPNQIWAGNPAKFIKTIKQ